MQELREPLFLGVEFLNIHAKDKNAPAISVRINLQQDDLIYAQGIKGRAEVVGYVDPDTGLFVAETEGAGQASTYHRFRLEAVRYAQDELMAFLEQLEGMDEEAYKAHGYKPYPVLVNALKKCLTDRQGLYADLQKQVNLVVSRKFPKVNEYLVFADDADIAYPVTARVPYRNPKGVTLPPEGMALVDGFLDTFFDEYNKQAFSWYMGAALSNVAVYDDRVSKLAVLSSSYGGSGKSTLAMAMANALFTPHYRDIKDDFDSFFAMNNRFGTSALSTKRFCIYSEASFNADLLSEEHNFSGMNVSSIKSLVTEGYISSEEKYAGRDMEKLSGFHLVLTNHPPVVSEADAAMNRRILPIMVRPTTMAKKARELGLWGRGKLEAYVQGHAQEFAAYFVQVFLADEYLFSDREYDYRDYVQDIKDAQELLDESQRKARQELDVLKGRSLLDFLSGVEKEKKLDFSMLKKDILTVLGGGTPPALEGHMRKEGDSLYIDASKSFLLRYGQAGAEIRACLKEFYGAPEKRFHKRMFRIRMAG